MIILNIALGIVAGVVLLFMLPFILGFALFIVPSVLFMFLFRDADAGLIAIFFSVCVLVIAFDVHRQRKELDKKMGKAEK